MVTEINIPKTASDAFVSFPVTILPILLWLGPLYYVEKRISVWSDCESLDFILDNEEQISFFGKYPYEGRIKLHAVAYVLFLIAAMTIGLTNPVYLIELMVFIFVITPTVFIAHSLARSLFHLLFGPSSDPDENKGKVRIRGLKSFSDDVKNLSIPDSDSNEGKGKTTFSFELLVDRLGSQVESLSARLQVYEKSLDEATKEKWRYTLRVPEVDQGLNQIRKCSERILYPRVIKVGHKIGPRTGLDQLKSILEKNKAIDSNALSDIEVILAKTSPGSHATTGYAESDDDYIMALRALANLVEWHFDHPVEEPVVLPEAN
jgi:hypothetical protein